MKNLFYCLVTSFIVLVSFACSKDRLCGSEARLQGKVLEKGSNKPLAGWKIYISSCTCELLNGCDCTVRDSLVSNSDGSYSYDYDYESFGHVFAYPKVQEGYFDDDYRVLGPYQEHNTYTKDIIVDAKAWIKFHIYNDKPFDQFDSFDLNGSYNYIGNISLGGIDANKTFKCLVTGNDSTSITQYILKNKKQTIKKSKVFAPAHDTTFYEIKY